MFDVYIRFCCRCFLIVEALSLTSASMQLIENVNNTGKFSQIYPVIYSNLTEFNDPNVRDFPKRPQDFQIEYITNKQVKLKWKIDQESLKFLKGFGLQVICNYGLCKIPEVDNITVVPHNNKERYFDLILDIKYGSSDIKLYSLPHKNDCYSTVRRTVVMVIRNTHELSSNWTSPVFIFSQQKNNLEVNFRNAPYQINRYKICLQNEKNSSRCSTIEKPPAKFENIADGSYGVMVTPFDPSSSNKNCFCKDEDNCTICEVTETSYITYKEICETLTFEEYVYPLVGGLVIGILVLLILFYAVKINGLRCRNLEKKSILLIHTSDNEIHEKAVEHFITCLENVNIIVHRPSLLVRQEELRWLISIFDNVLLLDSLALGKRQEAWAVGEDYGQFLREANSKELTKYLFSVIGLYHDPKKEKHFLRCKWNFVPEESEFKNYPSTLPTFIIPDDLQLLAETIHGSSVDLRACKFSKSMLKQTVLEEAKFIMQNSNWFCEKYGTSTCTETEVELSDQSNLYPVLNTSDFISHVSSHLHKMNQATDKELGVNPVSLNGIEVTSV